MQKILINKIRCNKCGDEIESRSRHDFVVCKCGSVGVDGGHDYLKRIGNCNAITELSVIKTEPYRCISLREMPWLKTCAAEWFHEKWGTSTEAYLACMEDYLIGKTEYGWYLCLDGKNVIGGLGVIDNDFHTRKDLSPNICAVYTEKEYRGQGIAGQLIHMAVTDLKEKRIVPVYLLTDLVGFYERYGFEFLCMVQNEGSATESRMYIHK